MSTLKAGDVVHVTGVVKGVNADGSMHIKIGQNKGWQRITEADVVKVAHYKIKVGDKVRFKSGGGFGEGEVLALQQDQHMAIGLLGEAPLPYVQTWAWIRLNNALQQRVTIEIADLIRI